jgi:hypothetical protein
MAQEWLTHASGIQNKVEPELANRAGAWLAKHYKQEFEMAYLLIGTLLIHFAVQTVFLLAALWIMIKIQKLNYNFLGLLGAAALASAIKLIPLPFYIADILSCTVLLFCISKVTGAEYIDVKFTVVVGYALMFGMNLGLFGALLGDLRPSAREATKHPVTEETDDDDDTPPTRQASAVGTNRTPLAAKAQSVKSPEQPLPPLTVKSLIRNGTKSCVTLQGDSDSRIIFLGDTELVHTATGSLKVRFDGLTNDFVLVTVGDQQVNLPAR